jgi:hypothetical protein
VRAWRCRRGVRGWLGSHSGDGMAWLEGSERVAGEVEDWVAGGEEGEVRRVR